MHKKNLKVFFGGSVQSEDANRGTLRMIEDDCLTDAAMASNLARSEKEIRYAIIISQEYLLEPHRVHQYSL